MNIRRQHILLLVLTLIIAGFIALSVLVALYPAMPIDIKVSREIQEHQNAFFDKAMFLISTPGYMPESVILLLVTSVLFFVFKYKKVAVYVLATGLTGLISTLVKALVNRPRPSKGLVKILYETTQQSFPSGHVLFYVVFFGFMILLMLQLDKIPNWLRYGVGLLSSFLIVTIPFSRIYLGAHWFTDVVGGFLLGLPCLYLLSWLYLRKPADKQEAPVAETK
ncbi:MULTISPECIES: phosphatase PAP2 family protein [unclassified Mucilaginibacter]|uniref:phosphatase PAP2 family protein n=1 Tax=unclassified Mucilaginibacter TaxID=2617802 RepID=UPI002AC9DDD1|nr:MULTISPECIES: phosphatase PAP2 family protein [unclassified Mucilaginibacter]MEB0262855.1 phosphatase PAP2 family protein [Mucilaginibacter sp. 10I4]MEB0277694.1 phosphatase PAP2 family protein [Mucilaginibacter sp. 10B2]MEB0301953.1 phosphatase PAP2 family protein [Mucilaginibacter sp. 5C4]WPX24679.1 phosphatase PAP2 family protein [Mucilaginibacter sp. 5C4]